MSAFRYLSVCSGIEAATVAWHLLGWQPVAFAEIDKFPRAVLAHHYPDVPLHGDFTTIEGDDYGPINLLVGGTPCQDFSVSGLRAGIAGERGNLTLEFIRLAARKKPRWIVWENVPGVLSSDGGRALGAFLGGLGELGYGFAYRVLDAQYFGLAQRRARLFVIGYLGDWRRAAAVLFERESLLWDPAPSREAGKVAPTIPSRSSAGGGLGTDLDCDGGLILAFGGNNTAGPIEVATAVNAHGGPMGRMDFESETFVAIAFSVKDHGADAGPISPTLRAGGVDKSHANGGVMPAVAFSIMPMNSGKDYKARETDIAQPVMAGGPVGGNQGGDYVVQPPIAFGWQNSPCQGASASASVTPTLDKSKTPAVSTGMAVRRLTPRECCRLQGFPDDYLDITYRGKPAADGPKYKALGNSMAVPVMAWIGKRIAMVDAIRPEAA